MEMVAPPQEPTENYGAPTPEEIASYGGQAGTSPEQIARETAMAQRANGPAAAEGNPSNPVVADPKWDPAVEATKVHAEEGKRERAAANPNGPAGDDGFPTYRDLSNAPGGMGGALAASPGVYVKPHWQAGTRSETVQHGIDESKLAPGQIDYVLLGAPSVGHDRPHPEQRRDRAHDRRQRADHLSPGHHAGHGSRAPA